MNNTEQRFWKIVTWFGGLPGILVPLMIITLITLLSLVHIGISPNDSIYNQLIQRLNFDGEDLIISLIIGRGGVLLSYSIGTIIKYFYYKPRPIPQDTSTLWKKINASSMPSIHTSNSLIIAIALYWSCMIFVGNYLNISNTNLIILRSSVLIVCFIYYVLVMISRVVLHKHYILDTIVGTMLGVVCVIGSLMLARPILYTIESIIQLFI